MMWDTCHDVFSYDGGYVDQSLGVSRLGRSESARVVTYSL